MKCLVFEIEAIILNLTLLENAGTVPESISARLRVPSTFRSVVAASRRVEWLPKKFGTYCVSMKLCPSFIWQLAVQKSTGILEHTGFVGCIFDCTEGLTDVYKKSQTRQELCSRKPTV